MCTHLNSGLCRPTECDECGECAHGAVLETVSSRPQESLEGLSYSTITPGQAAKSHRDAPRPLPQNREEECHGEDQSMVLSDCVVEVVDKLFLEYTLTNIFQRREREATEDESENDMPKSSETT